MKTTKDEYFCDVCDAPLIRKRVDYGDSMAILGPEPTTCSKHKGKTLIGACKDCGWADDLFRCALELQPWIAGDLKGYGCIKWAEKK